MAGFDQIGIYQRGTSSFDQYPDGGSLTGDFNSDFDASGNLISSSLGAGNYSTAATVRSFFKGPIGYNLNDNNFYGEKYFTINYKQYTFAELEYTIYRVGANTPSWWFHQILAWKLFVTQFQQNGPDIIAPRIWLNHYVEYDWSNPGDPTIDDCMNNGTVNWSPIDGPNGSTQQYFFRTRIPQFNYVSNQLTFCSSFGDLQFFPEGSTSNPFPSVFTDTPCYIKGMATLF